ncbi:MAG: hypothetical protein AAFY56_11625 [Pseudomonadota bacterium]
MVIMSTDLQQPGNTGYGSWKLPRDAMAREDYEANLPSARELRALESDSVRPLEHSLAYDFVELGKHIGPINRRVIVIGIVNNGDAAGNVAELLVSKAPTPKGTDHLGKCLDAGLL